MSRKIKGLFVNPNKANCSIHESGKMVYECLKLSQKYDIDYLELSAKQRQVPAVYDFYAFNYHHETMSWLDTASVRRLPGLKLTFILETLRNDPFVLCPRHAFDVYCALDPTMNVADPRVYAFPRPLEPAPPPAPFVEPEVPTIGTFGFATLGKGFELVVEAVNREFDRAKVCINIPPGTYTDAAFFALHNRDYAEHLTEVCLQTAKKGVEVVVTRDYMSKDELLAWCGQNTLNCFLYNRHQPGLAATTDQAISSGRPLAVSVNDTFRHIHTSITPYPLRSLKQSIEISQSEVLKLQQEWIPMNFARRFEEVLEAHSLFDTKLALPSAPQCVVLDHKTRLAPRIRRKAIGVVKNLTPPLLWKVAERRRKPVEPPPSLPDRMTPFCHPLLRSNSQFNEDLLLDLLFHEKKGGFYVDVGANDPIVNSNTKRFYDRGWSGINIEPGLALYERLSQARPRDVNLHIGAGFKPGTLTFYQIPADTSLSSFDENMARRMATIFGHSVVPITIQVSPLRDVLAQHAQNKTIDFLSVDAEGMDLDVLKSNDWKQYRPTLVLVEMNNQTKSILLFLGEQEYILLFNNEYNGLFLDLRTSDSSFQTLLEKHFEAVRQP